MEQTTRNLTKGLVGALAKVLKTVENPTKNCTNPAFKSKYADLSSVLAAARKAVADQGLTFTQVTYMDGPQTVLQTILMSDDGGYVTCDYPVTPVMNDPQGMGSALTYARRYSLCSVLGIVADDDDDGNEASKPGAAAQAVVQPARPSASTEAAKLPILEVIAKSKNMMGKFTAACNDAGLDFRDVKTILEQSDNARKWGDLPAILAEIKEGKWAS